MVFHTNNCPRYLGPIAPSGHLPPHLDKPAGSSCESSVDNGMLSSLTVCDDKQSVPCDILFVANASYWYWYLYIQTDKSCQITITTSHNMFKSRVINNMP